MSDDDDDDLFAKYAAISIDYIGSTLLPEYNLTDAGLRVAVHENLQTGVEVNPGVIVHRDGNVVFSMAIPDPTDALSSGRAGNPDDTDKKQIRTITREQFERHLNRIRAAVLQLNEMERGNIPPIDARLIAEIKQQASGGYDGQIW